MKNRTEFNDELSALMVKHNIGRSILVTEFTEGNSTFVRTTVFDDDKNKSRRNRLLKEAAKLFQKTGLSYDSFKDINTFLEASMIEAELISVTRDLKELTLSQKHKKKLESTRLNKDNAVKAEQWELAAQYRAEELEFLSV